MRPRFAPTLLRDGIRSPLAQEVEDAVQVVFLECIKVDGLLSRADGGRAGGFRAFLYGAARNVALRFEAQTARRARDPNERSLEDRVGHDEPRLSLMFDRAWAERVMKDAAIRQSERAAAIGEAAVRRVELLRLRFQEGLPIREIAERWNEEPVHLHHEYAKARAEFKQALFDIVAFDHPRDAASVEAECAQLLSLLG